MNTFKAKRIRKGIETAKYGPAGVWHIPFTPFSRALKHERTTLLTMNRLLTGDERLDYTQSIMSGMFGFMDESIKQSILATEGKYRRLARKQNGYKK